MWQEIVIVLIGIGVAGGIGWKVYKFFSHPPKAGDPCGGCTGCALKDKNPSFRHNKKHSSSIMR